VRALRPRDVHRGDWDRLRKRVSVTSDRGQGLVRAGRNGALSERTSLVHWSTIDELEQRDQVFKRNDRWAPLDGSSL
jgi:hypothetical protein